MPRKSKTPSVASLPAGALSLHQFCADYSIGLTRTYDLIRRGELPAFKVGRHTVIRRVDAEAWLAALPAYGTANVVTPPKRLRKTHEA